MLHSCFALVICLIIEKDIALFSSHTLAQKTGFAYAGVAVGGFYSFASTRYISRMELHL